MLTWGKWRANRAFLTGDLIQSAAFLKSILRHQRKTDLRLARKLTQALMIRARSAISSTQISPTCISAAWKDLSSASDIVLPKDEDQLSREKNNLVNATVQAADKFLIAGNIKAASRIVRELKTREILDTRASRISKATDMILSADYFLSTGAMAKAKKCIDQAKDQRPDLSLLEDRQRTIAHQFPRMKYLTKQLEKALLAKDHQQIATLSGQLLEIAPKFQIALDARAMVLSEITTRKSAEPPTNELAGNLSAEPLITVASSAASLPSNSNQNPPARTQRPFLLWIDSVGGFFVCPSEKNFIGAAVAHSHVEIPLTGELNRRHARIDRVKNGHQIVPFGSVRIDGTEIKTQTRLTTGQVIEMDGGVRLRYSKPGEHFETAQLEYASRHRTQPWSDRILLCNGTILIGPDPSSHIVCPKWNSQVTIFWQDDRWLCSYAGQYRVDGQRCTGQSKLKKDSRIVGADFSMSLEAIE